MLISCMCPLLNFQVTRPRERLVTVQGFGFFSCVDSHVSSQAVWMGEGLCTLVAGVRRHATVCPFLSL